MLVGLRWWGWVNACVKGGDCKMCVCVFVSQSVYVFGLSMCERGERKKLKFLSLSVFKSYSFY